MKTKLLKKLRKKAMQFVYITRKMYGFVVWMEKPFRERMETFDTFSEAKDCCDRLRREYIIDQMNWYHSRKKRRVY